jgi:hypothetical protein
VGATAEGDRHCAEHASAHVVVDGLVEDRLLPGIDGQQRFDFGLQRAVVTAPLAQKRGAIFGATGRCRIEDLFHPLPPHRLAHAGSYGTCGVILRESQALALRSSRETVDREIDSAPAISSSVRPPK